jgi:hypothetical protein
VRQVRPHLRKYGAKAQLARLLGLPRQRLQDCLKAGSASLDAEHTLLLLGWLGFSNAAVNWARPYAPGASRATPPARSPEMCNVLYYTFPLRAGCHGALNQPASRIE